MRTEQIEIDGVAIAVQTDATRAYVKKLFLEGAVTITGNPILHKAALAGWERIKDRIDADALAKRPKPASYEVHHLAEMARLWFVCDIAENHPVHVAVERTLKCLTEGFK